MSTTLRRRTAWIAALALFFGSVPAFGGPAATGARLEGLLLGVDGRPASGYQVVLVEPSGEAVAAAATSRDGLYSFKDLAAGTYAMGIEGPDGIVAPVAADPVEVAAGRLVRRDVTLMEIAPGQVQQVAGNYGLKIWWVSRTRAEKIWTVVGIVGGLAILFALLDDDDDEPTASAAQP